MAGTLCLKKDCVAQTVGMQVSPQTAMLSTICNLQDHSFLPHWYSNIRPCYFLAGINIINAGKTYEKIVLAARILATIENPNDVCVISARPYGHRAVLKYAGFTGAQAIAGRL
jgi:hypothetical protein